MHKRDARYGQSCTDTYLLYNTIRMDCKYMNSGENVG